MELLLADPLPYRTEPPIVSAVNPYWLGEGERLISLVVQQAPDVHFAATTEELAQSPARDEAFVAERGSSGLTRKVGFRIRFEHVVALRITEGIVRSGDEELARHDSERQNG